MATGTAGQTDWRGGAPVARVKGGNERPGVLLANSEDPALKRTEYLGLKRAPAIVVWEQAQQAVQGGQAALSLSFSFLFFFLGKNIFY